MNLRKFKKQDNKFTLTLNSHSLSYFQNCEEHYHFAVDLSITKDTEEYYPFVKGGIISKVLELWYRAKLRKYSSARMEELEFKLFKIVTQRKDLKKDGLHIGSRLMQYFEKYREEKWQILAIEKGFSKILYEDQHVLFTYEGRPDLIVDFGSNFGHGPVDHKSESRKFGLYHFQNQFLGYCWASNSTLGVINYIGLQIDSNDGDVLRRESFNFLPSQIEQWKSDTIAWYYRVMKSIVNKSYLRSWRCEGKYGLCQFTNICEQPNERTKLIKIKNEYKEVPKYSSW